MSSTPYQSRGRGRGHNANSGNSYDRYSGNRGGRGHRSPQGDSNRGGYDNSTPRDRGGRGGYDNSTPRGNFNRDGRANPSPRDYSGRGGYDNSTPRGNYNRRGQGAGYNRGGHTQSNTRSMVDNNLINSQNVEWQYTQLGLEKPEFVKRQRHLTKEYGSVIKLMTNHFSFQISPDVFIHHYNFSWLYHGTPKQRNEPKEKKLNRVECYKLFDAILQKNKEDFVNASVGYDGSANVFLPCKLESSELSYSDVKVNLASETESPQDSIFSVKFQFVKTIPLSLLKDYYSGSETDDVKRQSLLEAIQALHIILKFPARNNMIALGRLAMFPIDGERHSLSPRMELALGHRKSIRFSEIGLTLVVDRASAAFLKSGTALDFMLSFIDLQGQPLPVFRPNSWQVKNLKKVFASIKVSTDHLKFIRKYEVKSIAEEAADIDTFKLTEDGTEREITVADYFRTKFNRVLKYPNLPCIITTNGSKIPIEMCKIVRNQSLQSVKKHLNAHEQKEMINQTATAPNERFTCLLQAHSQIREQVNDALRDFNINIGIKPIGLDGIVLGAPTLLYHGKVLEPKDTKFGSWNLNGKIFFKNKTFENFGILNFGADADKERTFRDAFINKALEMKMLLRRDPRPMVIELVPKGDAKQLSSNITQALRKMKESSCAFALCIFPEDKAIYNLTKRIADTILHFPTQGVAMKNVTSRPSPQTIANILAKINKKLGGVNVILKENDKPALLRKRIMIIGADVTHPGEADELHSSVAASVSTYDKDHTMFYPSVRVQPKKNAEKTTVEIIKDFKSMVQDHLKNYKEKNGFLPEIILYLRDGVSEGQYAQILNEEVIHLKRPYDASYRPKVTAVIISKRILSRARPVDSKDGVGNNLNVPPGTTIDSIITHPSDFDYFQYGHKGIKGTSRPCHYYLVHDDNKMSIDEMAKISFYLCFIFERATSSTSAPAPVMHAHNLAFKARQWISSSDLKCDLKSAKGDEKFKSEEKIARELNTIFSNINVDYARRSMFYI